MKSLPKISTEPKFIRLRTKTHSHHSSSFRLKSEGPKVNIRTQIEQDLCRVKTYNSNFCAHNRVSTNRIKLLSEHIRQMKNLQTISQEQQIQDLQHFNALEDQVAEANERAQLSQVEHQCLLARKRQHKADNLIYKERITNLRKAIERLKKQLNHRQQQGREQSHKRISQLHVMGQKRDQIEHLRVENERQIDLKKKDLQEGELYQALKIQRIEKNFEILYLQQQHRKQKANQNLRHALLFHKFANHFLLHREAKCYTQDPRTTAFQEACALYGSQDQQKFVQRFLNEQDLEKALLKAIDQRKGQQAFLVKQNRLLEQRLAALQQEQYLLSLQTYCEAAIPLQDSFKKSRQVLNRVNVWIDKISQTLECPKDCAQESVAGILARLKRELLKDEKKIQQQKDLGQKKKLQGMLMKYISSKARFHTL